MVVSSRSTLFLLLLAGCCVFWILVILNYLQAPIYKRFELSPAQLEGLNERVEQIAGLVREEQSALRALRSDFERAEKSKEAEEVRRRLAAKPHPLTGAWPEPIPILVFVCNRAPAISAHLQHLISKRPSAARFPIIVSQDCDSEPVKEAVGRFRDNVTYIKHESGAKAKIHVPPNHHMYTTYYRIARHYKLGLEYVFNTLGHTSVIITEDDLDVADDFFEYFSATRRLLEVDRSLWCVTAWNDNGKAELVDHSNPGLLYRSDFFAGLGWMMTAQLWKEIGPKWPSGFWDDWMRDPAQRQGRACIRPELSRTAMTPQGKSGASRGLFFDKHLIKVELSRQPVNFSQVDLRYLTKDKYDGEFMRLVYEEAMLMTVEDAQKELMNQGRRGKPPIRIEYTGNMDYIRKADVLRIMHDFKAGVPRTAYQGVVACFINGRRVFLARDRSALGEYNPSWHVPDNMDSA